MRGANENIHTTLVMQATIHQSILLLVLNNSFSSNISLHSVPPSPLSPSPSLTPFPPHPSPPSLPLPHPLLSPSLTPSPPPPSPPSLPLSCPPLPSFPPPLLLPRTALQYLYKSTELARKHNYYVGGLSHTWMTYYKAQLTDDGVCLNEWYVLYSALMYMYCDPY